MQMFSRLSKETCKADTMSSEVLDFHLDEGVFLNLHGLRHSQLPRYCLIPDVTVGCVDFLVKMVCKSTNG